MFTLASLGMCRRRAALHLFHAQCRRAMSAVATEDLRTRLTTELKSSMKARNASASTVLRSVLSEVYSADKSTQDGSKVQDSIIEKIMQKGVLKRTEAASQFTAAARPDLAEKEMEEIKFLQNFLPPMPTEADVDRVMQEVLTEKNIDVKDKRAQGTFFKEFYARISKDSVDSDLVKRKANAIFSA